MRTKYKLLNSMLDDMQEQSTLYRPTSFWEYGSQVIINELEKDDIKNFRSLKANRNFFVPCYSFADYYENKNNYDELIKKYKEISPDIRTHKKFERLLSGRLQALDDYRTLVASNKDTKPYTDKVSESSIGNPIEQFEFGARKFSRSFLNYLLGLNFLKQTVDTSDIKTVMEIGGGFGSLGEILLGDKRNSAFYINADIPPVGFVSSYYLKTLLGDDKVADYEDLQALDELDIHKLQKKYNALNICAWQIPLLKGNIDLFVNFISFQEMEPDVVRNYCNYIDALKPKYILLRNMLEGKRVKSSEYAVGVETPILGDDYNNFLPNYRFVAADSEVYGFITEDNFHSQLRIYERV